jgi:hypothetical protein
MSTGSIAESLRDLFSVVCGEELTTSMSVELCDLVFVEIGEDRVVKIVTADSIDLFDVIDFISSS